MEYIVQIDCRNITYNNGDLTIKITNIKNKNYDLLYVLITNSKDF